MTESDRAVAADLADLHDAGRRLLPLTADYYAQASRHIHNSSWEEEAGFVGEWRGGTIVSPVLEPFADLRDLLQRYVADTAVVLDGIGDVLVAVAEELGHVDDGAAAELDEAAPEVMYPDMPHDLDSGDDPKPRDEPVDPHPPAEED